MGINKKIINAYPETHLQGSISIEQTLSQGVIKGDIGIQIAEDGKIYLNINNKTAIRFKPFIKEEGIE